MITNGNLPQRTWYIYFSRKFSNEGYVTVTSWFSNSVTSRSFTNQQLWGYYRKSPNKCLLRIIMRKIRNIILIDSPLCCYIFNYLWCHNNATSSLCIAGVVYVWFLFIRDNLICVLTTTCPSIYINIGISYLIYCYQRSNFTICNNKYP